MRLSKTFGQTEGIHSLFGFSKHGGLRDMEGKQESNNSFLDILLSVASRFKCPIQMGAVVFYFPF